VPAGSKLFVFSDGAYEISGKDGRTRQLPELIQELVKPETDGIAKLDLLVNWARSVHGQSALEDDLSLMELTL
jgi:sigma-B regulation protein RsbU (phosphoserine phosphatase)